MPFLDLKTGHDTRSTRHTGRCRGVTVKWQERSSGSLCSMYRSLRIIVSEPVNELVVEQVRSLSESFSFFLELCKPLFHSIELRSAGYRVKSAVFSKALTPRADWSNSIAFLYCMNA